MTERDEPVFEDTGEDADDWVDVRMTDPQEGEWDLDAVLVGGRVEYVDLRIRPELLASFIDCLVEDASPDRTASVLAQVAEWQGVDPADVVGEE